MSSFATFFSGHEAFPDRQAGTYVRIVEVNNNAVVQVVDKDSVTNPESKDINTYAKFNGWSMNSTENFARFMYFVCAVMVNLAFAVVGIFVILAILSVLGLTGSFIAILIEFAFWTYFVLWPQNFLNPIRIGLTNLTLSLCSYINNGIRNIFRKKEE